MTTPFLEVVVFGSSTTWSHRNPYGERYVDYIELGLQSRFGNTHFVDVAACGDGGDTAELALARIDRDCIAYKPDTVVIGLGSNDAFSGLNRDQCIRNYRKIVETIQRETNAIIVLETQPTLDENLHSRRQSPQALLYGGLEKYLEKFTHSYIRDIAKKEGLLLHDRFAIFHALKENDPSTNTRLILNDGVHLTSEGNQVFANTLIELLYPALAKKSLPQNANPSLWLNQAISHIALLESSEAIQKNRLQDLFTRKEFPARLLLQQCRSFARRAFASSNQTEMKEKAHTIALFTAGLLACQRAYNPYNKEVFNQSIEWGLFHLRECAHPLAEELKNHLITLKEDSIPPLSEKR